MKKQRFDPYSNYYYKVNIKKSRKAKFLTILFVLLSLSIVIFFSISFSNFLTISKIVNVNSNFIFEGKTLYAISLETHASLSNAQTKSEEIKKQGGAGFVLNNGANEFKVLTSVYEEEKDAKRVKTNLENSGNSVEIIKLEMPAFNFKINLSSSSSNILSNAINMFYLNYKSLYNLSIDYDSGKTDLTSLKSSLISLKQNNEDIITEFNNKFNKSSNIYVLYVKIYIKQANEIIKELEIKDESINISSEIKYAYCKIINAYLDLYNEML